ncbi:MAG: 4-hydroxy-tetrahydrodipicolinate reductase [Chloroflexota bacterium]
MRSKQQLKVAVHGAAGRVGCEVLRAVAAADDMTLVAAIDRLEPAQVKDLPGEAPYYTDARAAFEHARPDVVVDFSLAAASVPMCALAIGAGASPVIGTTGISAEQVAYLDGLCREHRVGGLLAPNFTIGAVLLAKLAALAAPYFEYVEIAEEHHQHKVDSPSGTALGIAEAIHQAHPERFAHNDPEREPLDGARGADFHGIAIHATRMPGRLAHHLVTFGDAGQTLSLRHDTIDRECYMPGVLLAARKVRTLKGLAVGLDKVMDL